MSVAGNILQNNTLGSLLSGAPASVIGAIQQASVKTGVDFAYLVQQAAAESSFDPQAKAKTSSATGLFQFIESTWMNMVEKHGEKYGIDTSQDRKSLLELRKDPEKASALAAELAAENKTYLEKHVGGDIGATEMYFAHFMGAGGASQFLNALHKSPQSGAADLFPREAKANQAVFYDSKTGQKRSLEDVYAFFDKKFGAESATPAPEPKAVNQSEKYAFVPPEKPVSIENPRDIQGLINQLFQDLGPSLSVDPFFPKSLYGNMALSTQSWLALSTLQDL